MSRKKTSTSAELPDRELQNHLYCLGLGSIEDYQAWCLQHGFSRKLNKSDSLRQRERRFLLQTQADQQLRCKKRDKRKEADILLAICRGEVSDHELTSPPLLRLSKMIRRNKRPKSERRVDRQTMIRLLTHLQSCRAKLFDADSAIAAWDAMPGNSYPEALAMIAAYAPWWLRPVEQWKPRTHNVARQFASLLRHLFVQYDDMPLFFDTVWFVSPGKEAARHREWYLYVGKGQSIRDCPLPIPLTKKMAHHFMQAPKDLSVDQAIRWGQVHGLGGDEHLARAILGTRLGESFKHDDFWTTVIRWFISHPMLDRAHVGPIVDYLHHQRYVPFAVALGQEAVARPPQPNLSMKGRTPDGVLARVEQWHRKLANDNRQQIQQWKPVGIVGFEFLEGSQLNNTHKTWTIRELLSSKALVVEGRQMSHCVASYAWSCSRGRCSIWTMEVQSREGFSKAITIEVNNAARVINQARGKLNRLPTEKERSIIQRWAEAAGLRMSKYV